MILKNVLGGTLKGKYRAKETAFLVVLTVLLTIPTVSAYECFNSSYLKTDSLYIDGQEVSYDLEYCPYGCIEEAYLTFGNPGCEESPLLLAVISIIFVVVVAIIIERWNNAR